MLVFIREHNDAQSVIDIFNEIYKKNVNSVLLLVGDGELNSEIRERVKSYNLSDNVIFYGTTGKVNELYQAMDCFVFPSHLKTLVSKFPK